MSQIKKKEQIISEEIEESDCDDVIEEAEERVTQQIF